MSEAITIANKKFLPGNRMRAKTYPAGTSTNTVSNAPIDATMRLFLNAVMISMPRGWLITSL